MIVRLVRMSGLERAPLASELVWLDCIVGAAFLEALDKVLPPEQRLPAPRLFMSLADDPL